MRLSMIVSSLIIFIVGLFFTTTIIGAIIGIPLILMSIVFFILGIIIPGKLFKKLIKVAFFVLLVYLFFAGFSLLSDNGKSFWNEKVITPVLKPFSEQCNTNNQGINKECQCEGTLLEENYCYGTCSDCLCTKLNDSTQEPEEIECVNGAVS